MTPENVRMLIPQYLAGDLTPDELEMLESRMDTDLALKQEVESLREVWLQLGLLPEPEPGAALRAQFYQKLNAAVRAQPRAAVHKAWWLRPLIWQGTAAAFIFLLGALMGTGLGRFEGRSDRQPNEMAQLRGQVEGLRQTVALSLMQKPSASSRLEGVEWSSQVNKPDQELMTALQTTLNEDPNINVRLAALDALEKFTTDGSVRRVLEQSISKQQSPLVQIALIDALVHIRDHSAAAEFKQLSGNAGVNAVVRQRAQWAVEKLSLN
jgi:hypothetical protein